MLLALALAAAGASAALAQEPGSPEEHELGRLFTQTAKRGTLKPVKGKPRFTLKLRGVAPQVVWFDDRPERQTGQMPVGGFVRSWEGFGFGEVPPNAALTLLDAADHQDTVVLKLGSPRYKKQTRTVRYPATVLDAATGNLSHLEPHRDERVPRRFSAASLFIDDGGYGLPPGCQPGRPYIKCTYTSSTTFSFDEMHTTLEKALGPQTQLSSTTPVWIQAWGGRGARGGSSQGIEGAFGGYAGYAISVSSVDALSGDELYLYVGANGSEHANYSGQGGGSTIVSTQAISNTVGTSLDGVQVVAGGSGGGARSCSSTYLKGGRGGDGGVAIASNSPNLDVTGAGESGGGDLGPGGGGSGDDDDAGDGGAAGDDDASAGTRGLGGYGGQGSQGSTVGWVNVDEVDPAAADWNAGAGGRGRGGGGGGGYGGGGGGGGCVKRQSKMSGGGGGGGSFARHLVFTDDLLIIDPDSPFDSKQGDGAQSQVVLTFNLGFNFS